MVVRHKVLGVGPKHRFVLQDVQHKNKEGGERKRDRQKKKQLDRQQRSSDSTRHFGPLRREANASRGSTVLPTPR